jgi:S-phase kinase-associated protein 1
MADDNVTLMSSDTRIFEIPRAVADCFGTIKNLLADCEGDDTMSIPLPNVTGAVLAKVLEYAIFHASSHDSDAVTAFDKAFVAMEKDELFSVVLAANYLNHAALLDATCQAVADMIKDKSPEEIRAEFGIENDFTPDEEAEIRAQNQWAFD